MKFKLMVLIVLLLVMPLTALAQDDFAHLDLFSEDIDDNSSLELNQDEQSIENGFEFKKLNIEDDSDSSKKEMDDDFGFKEFSEDINVKNIEKSEKSSEFNELSFDEFNDVEDSNPKIESNSNDKNTISFFDFSSDKVQKLYIILFFLITAAIIIKFENRNAYRIRNIILLLSLGLLGFYYGGCICSIGSMQKFFIGFLSFNWDIIFLSIFIIILVSTLLFGKIFCGYACPIGALQEFVYRKKISFKIPDKVHNVLKYLKYVVLILVIVFSLIYNDMILKNIEPFKVAFNFGGSLIQIILFIIFIIASLFIFRPWCKYFCPLGAFLSIISRLGFANNIISDGCTNCNLCKKECDYSAITKDCKIDKAECIQCGACKIRCPRK